MWIEAIFAREDVERILTRAMPITIDLDDAGNHVTLTEPKSVELVPDAGLRVQCAAHVLWTVLGIHVPITLHTVTALFRPQIVKGAHGDALVFGLVIEHADFAGLPTVVDNHLTERINGALEAAHLDLSWDFSQTLSGSFLLPASLHPLETISLAVAWGKLRVTPEALVMAISFHSELTRHDDSGARVAENVALVATPVTPQPIVRTPSRNRELAALGVASALLGAISVYGAFRMGARRARLASLNAWLRR